MKVSSINQPILQILLDGARYPIVTPKPDIPIFVSHTVRYLASTYAFGLWWGGILPSIKWVDIPEKWKDYSNFWILLDIKIGWLKDELKRAEKLMKEKKRILKNKKKGTPNDTAGIQEAEKEYKGARKKFKEIEREAKQLNDNMDEEDLEEAWKIVKANIEEKIEELKGKKERLERRAQAAPPNSQLKASLEEKVQQTEEDIKDYQEQMDAAQEEVD